MTHCCHSRTRWHRLLHALPLCRRRTACTCTLTTGHPITVTGDGSKDAPWDIHL